MLRIFPIIWNEDSVLGMNIPKAENLVFIFNPTNTLIFRDRSFVLKAIPQVSCITQPITKQHAFFYVVPIVRRHSIDKSAYELFSNLCCLTCYHYFHYESILSPHINAVFCILHDFAQRFKGIRIFFLCTCLSAGGRFTERSAAPTKKRDILLDVSFFVGARGGT